MKSKNFHCKCPCCGEALVVDTRLRRVESGDPTKKSKSNLLDDANRVLDADKKRAQDSFDQAFADEQKEKPSLDDYL